MRLLVCKKGPKASPRESLLKELANNAENLNLESPAVKAFKATNNWDELPPKGQYSFRDSLYQQCKLIGVEKSQIRPILAGLFPVASEVVDKKAAQKKAYRLFDEKVSAFNASYEKAMANLNTLRDEVDADRRALLKEKNLFAGKVAQQQIKDAKVERISVSADSLLTVKVDGRDFALCAEDIKEKGGFLKHVFFDAWKLPTLSDGVYELHIPHGGRDDFDLVARYYQGNLPKYISRETEARLLPMMQYLDLDDMISAVHRNSSPPEKQWQIKTTSLDLKTGGLVLSKESHMTLEPGWEPVMVNCVSDSNGFLTSLVRTYCKQV